MKQKSVWQKWRIEIIGSLLALLGLFLLFEPFHIRDTLQYLLWDVPGGIIQVIARRFIFEITHITLSDALGMGLLIGAILLVGGRIGHHLKESSPQLTSSECPVCSSPLRRSHRSYLERLFGWLLPIRRYRCKNSKCRWVGLRLRG